MGQVHLLFPLLIYNLYNRLDCDNGKSEYFEIREITYHDSLESDEQMFHFITTILSFITIITSWLLFLLQKYLYFPFKYEYYDRSFMKKYKALYRI
jgi:hypothetical protein